MKNLLKLSLLTAAVSATTIVAADEQKFVTIGTGGQTGVYYVVGQSICKLVNRNIKDHGIKCNAPSTGGSVANLNAIAAGEQNMGVAQSDIQYQAYNGSGKFKDSKNEKLRALFSVHPEPFTVVARADSGVNTFTDIKGKRVNIGNPGSGTRDTMSIAMKALNLNLDDLALKSELKPAEMASALCDNNLDVITYTVGHPSGAIKEAGASCDAKLVSVTGEGIDKLIADNPYYAKAIIPGGMYKGNDKDVDTFGVYATFVSSTDTDNETVYQVVKAVFDNFERFKKLHPAFANLKKEDMVKNALSAPLHDGAMKYYKEAGLIK
ncbi:MAG: C4-dicarboxylate ABC transporter substrate-binding protein [Gammaproteobacteria bacterium]|nr:MAG: C4-dicarboxylate ABC transporter substrate-binding protein [Gammaproteobacteria bacterium]